MNPEKKSYDIKPDEVASADSLEEENDSAAVEGLIFGRHGDKKKPDEAEELEDMGAAMADAKAREMQEALLAEVRKKVNKLEQ